MKFIAPAFTLCLSGIFASASHAQTAITASIGDFITPVSATASSAQSDAGRTATRLDRRFGLGRKARRAAAFILHSANVFEGGASMWNGDQQVDARFRSWGKHFQNVSGAYIWNYNEGNGYNSRVA